ncbi:hypothetical protein [Streptomyces lasiicapitis]|uniref:hypothetical protein n=1 Tax=Streptomyces lasiicapitis TaxID=1923961 RepID=UPI00368B0F13
MSEVRLLVGVRLFPRSNVSARAQVVFVDHGERRIILQRKGGESETTVVYSIDDEGFDAVLNGPNGAIAKRRYRRLP